MKSQSVAKTNIVIVKLFKNTGIQDAQIAQSKPHKYDFTALGDYDRVDFETSSDMNGLVGIIEKTGTTMEQSILIPATDDEFCDEQFGLCKFGAISFFLVDEKKETNLFSLANEAQESIDRLSSNKISGTSCIKSKTYITMGSSAIAMIGLCENTDDSVTAYESYLKNLQTLVAQKDWLVYTYTILFLNPDKFVDLETGSPKKLKNVLITFSWSSRKVSNICDLFNEIEQELSHGSFVSGMLPGTNDYFIFMNDVEMSKLVSLYKTNGILASHKPSEGKIWYGDYCNSSFTTLCFPLYNCGACYNSNSPDYSNVDHTSNNPTANYAEIQKIVKGFSAYCTLKDSIYTRWVYYHYEKIVNLFNELLGVCNGSGIWFPEHNNRGQVETQKFCDLLNHMLESLLNTSAYMTISPSYPRIANNCLPRLLLCYQNKINQLVEKWDDKYNAKNSVDAPHRQHYFFLHVQDVTSMRTYVFFQHLPPDQRIISVDVPLQQACQPEVLLPMLVHEAGHSVGVRNRKNRLDFFVELAVHKFCLRLLEKMFDKNSRRLIYLFQESTQDTKAGPSVENKNLRALIIHAFFALSESFEDICKRIKDDYELRKKNYIKSLGDKDKSRKYAIRENYSVEMSIILRRVFRELLTDSPEFILHIFRDHFKNWLDTSANPQDVWLKYNDALQSYASKAIPEVMEGLNNQGQDHGETSFLSDQEMILGEVAADIFMVRICSMSSKDYLELRFNQYIGKNLENNSASSSNPSLNLIITHYAYMQIIAVYAVILLSEKVVHYEDLATNFDEVKKSLPKEVKRQKLQDAFCRIKSDDLKRILDEKKDSLVKDCIGIKKEPYEDFIANIHLNILWNQKLREGKKWVAMLQNIAYPIETVIEYAWLIYNDPRYDDFVKEKSEICEAYQEACKSNIKEMFHLLYK